MSISREDFNKKIYGGTHKNKGYFEKVIRFLYENKDNAYTPLEISQILKIPNESVYSCLKKYEKKGLITHKRPYYIIKQIKEVKENG